jgi:hypothetical protein
MANVDPEEAQNNIKSVPANDPRLPDSRCFLWHILRLSRKPVAAAGQCGNRECGNKPRTGVVEPEVATMQRRNRRRQA